MSEEKIMELHVNAMIPFKPSTIYVDEFHKQYTESRGLPGRLAKMHAGAWIPRVWAISDTPFADGPSGLRGYLSVMQTSSWQDDSDFKYLVPDELDSLQKAIDNAITTKNTEEIVRMGGVFERRMLQSVMIRRNEESLWFSKEALILPKKHVVDVETPISGQFRAEIDALYKRRLLSLNKSLKTFNQKLKPEETARALPSLKNFVEHSRSLRHIAVWPFLTVMLREESIKLTLKDFKRPKGITD